jgi:hypothetical protein
MQSTIQKRWSLRDWVVCRDIIIVIILLDLPVFLLSLEYSRALQCTPAAAL